EHAGAHVATDHHEPAAADLDGGGEPKTAPRMMGLSRAKLYEVLFWMGCFTALLTAFYTFRAVFMTFWGPEKIPHEAGHHAHESPPVMCIPLWILSIGAAGLGLVLGHPTGIFDGFLARTIPQVGAGGHHETDYF